MYSASREVKRGASHFKLNTPVSLSNCSLVRVVIKPTPILRPKKIKIRLFWSETLSGPYTYNALSYHLPRTQLHNRHQNIDGGHTRCSALQQSKCSATGNAARKRSELAMEENTLEPTAWPNVSKSQPLQAQELAYITKQQMEYFVVFVGLLTLFNSVFDSQWRDSFHRRDTYVTGPLAFGPMSEHLCSLCFLPTCVRRNPELVGPKHLSITLRHLRIQGYFAFIYRSPLTRGRIMALSMAVTAAGLQFGPVFAGSVATVGWKWVFGVSVILAGVALVPVLFLPETYQPALSHQPGQRGEGIIMKAFARPFYVLFSEPILSFNLSLRILCQRYFLWVFRSICKIMAVTDLRVMYFEECPLVFQGVYGMSDGIAGLAALPSTRSRSLLLRAYLKIVPRKRETRFQSPPLNSKAGSCQGGLPRLRLVTYSFFLCGSDNFPLISLTQQHSQFYILPIRVNECLSKGLSHL
ncbi:conserved hypothetical protein [Microsporum canis CBS 113480]|uniref:Major facilitator superfamily (MFS) profile domain-containing protein n=1 Tax=Arthroderma otae (strain ATCC MYA-4605 / CBS 113480) TaxID=554155 RepID=C5FUN3_ARTOC|nr:conserved hypothetical protein [Microsporum canis CBS 113480]EEQ33617.1 conserved hypothetical protein [Microsporum canis CBS 113480]